MNENEEKSDDKRDELREEVDGDDLQVYLNEMKALETDFSDLEDLDFEELQEIQEAIAKVKEGDLLHEDKILKNDISPQTKIIDELEKQKEIKEELISDFSDLDEIDFDELRDMKEAIETVKHEDFEVLSDQEGKILSIPEVSTELEQKIKEELLRRKEVEEEELITPEVFLDYVKNKRDKIWYHALYYLVFNVEDNTASKVLLYDILKEVTSKSPIDPIPENQFYFGLGYLLRLTLNNKQIVRFLRNGVFKINVNIDILREILQEAGEPISTRPIIEEKEQKKMFKNFLDENFLDI
ncbi:MAG: hypothetical protein ACFE91_09060 [Promethearchaeota archaeon]